MINCLGESRLLFAEGKQQALVLNYVADEKTRDPEVLWKQAQEIWPYLKDDAEKMNVTNAILAAHVPTLGGGYNFVFVKKGTNDWNCLYKPK
jgi:hypothetical protein